MKTKALEIRGSATLIAALAVDMNPTQNNAAQRALLRRCGYACDGEPNVILTRLDGNGRATNDPYAWGDRTMATAHHWILDHWDELDDGDVVDVEFIRGERTTIKVSEVQGRE